MQPARPEPRLGDEKCAALLADTIAHRNAHAVKAHLAMSSRIVEPVHLQLAYHRDARSVDGHEHEGVAQVALGIRVAQAHEQDHACVRVGSTAGPPLASRDDVLVAVAFDPTRQLRGIRAGDVRFGDTDAGADLACEQQLQPLLLLLGRAELSQHLHISGVGRRTVDGLRCYRTPTGDLGQRRVLNVGESRTEALVRHEQVPQPAPASLRLELLHHRRDAMRHRGWRELAPVPLLGRAHTLVEKDPQLVLELAHPWRLGEVHRQPPAVGASRCAVSSAPSTTIGTNSPMRSKPSPTVMPSRKRAWIPSAMIASLYAPKAMYQSSVDRSRTLRPA